jgi:DNA replication protein DnaC
MTILNLNDSNLATLKLHGIRENLARRVKEAEADDLAYPDFLALVLHDEVEHRRQSRVARLTRNAAFRSNASIEGLDLTAPRGLEKKQIHELASCRFIDEGLNVLILGPTGVGKSYLATALGHAACRHGRATLFFRMNTLIEKLSLARASNTYLHLLKRLTAADLVVLDDFGLKPLSPQQYQDLYDILDERMETKATIITTQLPEENWSEVIDDPVTCEAVTRRVCEKAVRIQMRGDAFAKKRGKGLTKTDPS